MKTLIGMVTFGNLEFTKLAVDGIRRTVTEPYDMFLVVGKPYDTGTVMYLQSEGIPFIVHNLNWGFPKSLNDIYDYAWKEHDYDNLIVMGNDVIPYPYAIDSLIKVANVTDNAWVCAQEYDVKSLCRDFPEARKYFHGSSYQFVDFGEAEPWRVGDKFRTSEIVTNGAGLSDVHNLALFKKEVMEKIGYIDVNFYPAYYEDNDYVRRAIHANLKSCRVTNAVYFHFWSRTIHQGSGGSTSRYFEMNRNFYHTKWGGDFGHEKWDVPFNGQIYHFAGVDNQPTINIQDRNNEETIIRWWMSKR